MSTINKKPYIKSLLESMSAEDLQTLSTLIDGGGNQVPIRRTMNLPSGNKTMISSDDKGVSLCSLEVNYSVMIGYLIYNDDYCCLIHFSDSPNLKIFDIDTLNDSLKTIDEALSVVELRSEINGITGGGGGGGNNVNLDYATDSDILYDVLAILPIEDRELQPNPAPEAAPRSVEAGIGYTLVLNEDDEIDAEEHELILS